MTTEQTTETVPLTVLSILSNLKKGESHGFIKRLEGDEATKHKITGVRVRLNNLAGSAASRAKAKTGYTYTIEKGEIITRSLDMMIVVAVTRVA